MENNASIYLLNNFGESPLYMSCSYGNTNIVQTLLKIDSNLDLASNDGTTPLNIACYNGNDEVVQLLLRNNANIDLARNGETPLYIACNNGDAEIVHLLLRNNANLNSLFYNGWTPMKIAKERGFNKIIEILKDGKSFLLKTANLHENTLKFSHFPICETPTELISFDESISQGFGLPLNKLPSYYWTCKPIARKLFKYIPDQPLKEDEFYAIYYYTLKWKDSESLYSKLNKDITHEDNAANWKQYIHHLLDALKKMQCWNGREGDLYCATQGDLVSLHPTEYVCKKTITFNGFLSTTTDKNIATAFPNKLFYTLFIISGRTTGRTISKYSSKPGEQEVLFPLCSTFEIVHITRLDDRVQVHLEQI
uniref:NAD(P)(+)--arginine ADP-ribosyltransferase n=1 Tax=Arcella intermedia TaxID=1963864 RepID=A0A6B2L7T6_9EUKA